MNTDFLKDPKIAKLIKTGGWGYYGLYCALKQLLQDAPNNQLPTDYELLAKALNVNSKALEYIINNYGLFDVVDGYFRSPDVGTLMEQKVIQKVTQRKLYAFILLHRKMIEWEWFTDGHMFKVYAYCIMRANWKDTKWRGNDIKRGQFITSYQTIADETGISYQSVRTCLKKLIKTGELTHQSTDNFSIISVLKYDDYQSDSNSQANRVLTDDQQSANRVLTDDQQSANRVLTTDNNVNTVNNVETENNVNTVNTLSPQPPAGGKNVREEKQTDESLQNKRSPKVTVTQDNFEKDSCYPFKQFVLDYSCRGRHVDEGCFLAYVKITESDRAKLKEIVPKYVAAQSEIRFQKDPKGYLTNNFWDEPIVDRSNNNVSNSSTPGYETRYDTMDEEPF